MSQEPAAVAAEVAARYAEQPALADGQGATLDEFLRLCADNRRMEWKDGEVVVHLPPVTRQQMVVLFLSHLLGLFVSFFDRGRALAGPYLMLLTPEGPAREPDVLVVSPEHLHRVLRDRIEGAADLVVEVVSPDSVARDRSHKFDEYEEHGVREYWVVDPRPGRERADFWVLDAAGRFRAAHQDGGGAYRSTVLPGFWLRSAWLMADPLPDPLMTFAEIAGLPEAAVEALRSARLRGPLGS